MDLNVSYLCRRGCSDLRVPLDVNRLVDVLVDLPDGVEELRLQHLLQRSQLGRGDFAH
jgi:hypothetical protein